MLLPESGKGGGQFLAVAAGALLVGVAGVAVFLAQGLLEAGDVVAQAGGFSPAGEEEGNRCDEQQEYGGE